MLSVRILHCPPPTLAVAQNIPPSPPSPPQEGFGGDAAASAVNGVNAVASEIKEGADVEKLAEEEARLLGSR